MTCLFGVPHLAPRQAINIAMINGGVNSAAGNVVEGAVEARSDDGRVMIIDGDARLDDCNVSSQEVAEAPAKSTADRNADLGHISLGRSRSVEQQGEETPSSRLSRRLNHGVVARP